MEEIREIKLGGKHSKIAKVSVVDFNKVSEHKWRLLGEYAVSVKLLKMHQFVIGERPDDIPDDWVIDHKDRDKLNNCQSNLRWVSQSFNCWNTLTKGKSPYKGVCKPKNKKTWAAVFKGKHLGNFDDERKAGWAAAKAAIKEWGLWATESDLLTGPDLFTVEDIQKMQDEISKERDVAKHVRELPLGVYKDNNRYIARYAKQNLGSFKTILEAKDAYDTYVKELHEQAWSNHLLLDITRDDDGDAVIALSGRGGLGKFTKVPEQFWHILTFQKSWSLARKYASGRWLNKPAALHIVIFKLLNPDYVFTGNNSIDHINPENKLDNRKVNLRTATNYEQQRNKIKRTNTSSKYIGIHLDKKSLLWRGTFAYDGITYCVSGKTENEAAQKLNEKQLEVLGANARLISIIE